MSTKFSYWYLKSRTGGSFPIFSSPPETPKGYLTTWFKEKPIAAGAFPVDEETLSTTEFMEAGLAAGYGKESTWCRPYCWESQSAQRSTVTSGRDCSRHWNAFT